MCQEENVVAVATLTPKEDKAKIVYKVGNEVKEKKITIKKNPNNSGYYGGQLKLDDTLFDVLNNSKILQVK